MPISLEEDTEVITSDGKKIGKVKRIENDSYFTVYKKGLLTDEEIRSI
jgi:sporulation protein YlmC with PRC-barrel domain